jgi:hypothetical protein
MSGITATAEIDIAAPALSQDGNGSADEATHARENWEQVLGGLKTVAESD